MQSVDAEKLNSQIKRIKFFSIPLERVEAKFKMSQNRSDADQENVILNLNKGSHEDKMVST